MKRALVVFAAMALFLTMTQLPVQAQWWGKKAKKDTAPKTAQEAVPAVEAQVQEPAVAEPIPAPNAPELTLKPADETVEALLAPNEEARDAVPQQPAETPVASPGPAATPEIKEEVPVPPPVSIPPQQAAKPVTKTPQPAPVVSESDAKRAAISETLASGDTKRAFDELKTVLRTANKYHAIKEWATLELMNRAQAEGALPAVTKDLEAAAGTSYGNVMLQRAVAEGYLRQRDFNKVIAIYEGLEKSEPKDYVIATRLNDYYILGKQYDKAIARLEPIVTANPGDNYHSDILMNAYVQAGMEDKALAIFKQRLDREPKSPGLRARYAQALQDFGRFRESATEWEKAAQLDPKNDFFKNRAVEIRAKAR